MAPVNNAFLNTTTQLVQRQFEASLCIQHAGIGEEIARLRAVITELKQEATIAEGEQRIVDLRARSHEVAAAAGPPASVEPMDAEVDRAIAALEAGTEGQAEAWVRLSAIKLREEPARLAALVRPIFRSRREHRVVFRIQGGTHPTERSRELVHIDRQGDVRLIRGHDLSLNFRVFEHAVEFLLEHRRGAHLMVFEVEEAWFGAATPEQASRARLTLEGEATGDVTTGQAPGITHVPGLPRTVDTRYGDDQLQVDRDLIPELQEFIVPRSGRRVEFR